ncbi:MAG: hypothetical protein F4Z74_04150 [Acidobacteria bacterium]|nr:hypothetical protein [Acidobacteriota bacterium]MXW70629.1 hypothetical protein [Acidobacteriota bacterium]MYE44562.1 hypothetical protein [Acidobacteriota bacterium]
MTGAGGPRGYFRLALVGAWAAWIAVPAAAEPTFLSKQYPRCTACHYSPSGGGLLTPYGRSLSREELSTFGRRDATAEAGDRAEEEFLFGAVGSDSPLQLGLDFRPSQLQIEVAGRDLPDRNFLMNLDLQAAWRFGGWTAYGTAGRRPGGDFVSYEHWLARQVSDRVSIRGGRFLPAYGVRFADHTALSRRQLGLGEDDQVYGVELGLSSDRWLLQVAAGPGRAESLLDDDGRAALTVSGRAQRDLGSRTVAVASVLHRGAADRAARRTAVGASFGYAPAPWLTTWTQLDVQFRDSAPDDRAVILTNQTSVEVWRGVWLRISPQRYRVPDDSRAEIHRMVYGLDLYPRTHWHVNLSWYRDRFVFSDRLDRRLLLQLHLYL